MSEGIQKPNCGNCDSKKCEYPSGNLYCYRLDEMIDPVKTNLCGCFHNPNAREYLVQDVVKELESNGKTTRLPLNMTPTMAHRRAISEAIALIRDGVK